MRRSHWLGGALLAGGAWLAIAADRPWWRADDDASLPTLRVTRGRLVETAVAIGTVQAQVGAEVRVGSRLSGVVAELPVEVGDRVEKGAVLARLDDAEWRARLAIVEAEVEAAAGERDYASAVLERMRELGDLVAAGERDEAAKNLRVRQAEWARRQASLAEARLALDRATVRAPVAGSIASVSTYVGETVAASLTAPTFVTIVDLDRLEVRCFVDETDIGKVRLGQKATLRVDAFPGRELEGAVRAVYPRAQLVNNVVNFVVIVDLPPAIDFEVRPEMTVHADFVLAQRDGVIAVPRSSVLLEGGRTFVVARAGDGAESAGSRFAPGEDGRARGAPAGWVLREVRTGLATPQRIEIVDGLVEGEEIVADRQAWLKLTGESS